MLTSVLLGSVVKRSQTHNVEHVDLFYLCARCQDVYTASGTGYYRYSTRSTSIYSCELKGITGTVRLFSVSFCLSSTHGYRIYTESESELGDGTTSLFEDYVPFWCA